MDTSVQVANRKLCRACLRRYESRKDLISLQSTDQNSPSSVKIRFHDMLSIVMNQTLPENDALPSKICVMCLSSLRVSYYFRNEVQKSQDILINKAKSSGINIAIKQEAAQSSNNFPLILRPRHVEKDAFNESMIQDEFRESDGDEIIDYEPDIIMDYSDNEASKTENSTAEDGAFACDLCDRKFTSARSLQMHKTSHSGQCKYCAKKGNRQQLTLHTKYKHPEHYDEFLSQFTNLQKRTGQKDPVVVIDRMDDFYECCTCSIKFVSKIALVKHHAECDSKCIDCGLKIPRKDFYFKHLEHEHKYSSIDLSGYECPFCMTLFHTEKVLQDHIQRNHPEENQSNADTFSEAGESVSNDGFTLHHCKICSQSFQSSRSLKQHTTIKHKEIRDSLNTSDEKKTSIVQKYSKDEFFERFIVKKSNDFYRCIPCRKDIFKRSIILHVKSKHSAIRCFRCELCNEAFLRSDYRSKHFASCHSNSYKCITCDVQFDREYKYDAHLTKHGKIQTIFKPDEGADLYDLSPQQIQYIEDISKYDYANDHLLLNSKSTNMAQNVDVPLAKDDFCDKYMVSVSERNIRCNICNVEMQKNSVMSHLLWKHALNKPLKCSFCNERVVKNNARLSHMAKCHPNEYKCPDCHQQFVKHYLLADHVREAHLKKITTKPSSGEEDDLLNTDMRFVANRNEDEVIEENDVQINIDHLAPPVEKLYACQFCPKKFTSSKNLLIHKSHKHKNETLPETGIQEPVVQDASCFEDPISFEEFKQNWVEVISNTDLKCLVCELVMRNKSFSLHMKGKHSVTGAYLCALCPESFYRAEHRIQHMSQNHRGIFFCTTCNIQFYKNSRYAKHMNEFHGIEIDSYDSYEVDLGLEDLKFAPFINKPSDDDQVSLHSNSLNEPDLLDPIEEMMQLMSPTEEMSRTDFISRYIKSVGQERHCLACNQTFLNSSIYHHLIHLHATILPFKCPFCDVRFERTVQRSKHLQLFHPDEYKCNECGLQFPKFIKYSEHMSIEHNVFVTTAKSPYEENDLSSMELRYVAHKSGDEIYETYWQDDESSVANSTTYSEGQDDSRTNDSILKNIKSEAPTASYVQESLAELPQQNATSDQTFEEGEFKHDEFKKKYLKQLGNGSIKCLACNRMILKTALYAHLRLWHATTMIFNCELCPSGFRRGDYRMRHMAVHHPENYKCSECGLQFYYSALYKEHLLIEHKIDKNVQILKHKDLIDVPLKDLNFAPYIPEELRTNNPEATVSKVRKRKNSICLDRPSTSSHGANGCTYKEFFNKYIEVRGDISRCKACKSDFNKLAIKKHIKRVHSTSKPYYCQLCDTGFFRIDDRMNHMKKEHPDSFKCLMCDVQFYLSTSYIEHMASEHSMTVNIASNKSKGDVDVPFEKLRFKPDIRSETKIKTENNSDSDDDGFTRDIFSAKFLKRFQAANGVPHYKCTPCNKSFSVKNKRFHLLQNHSKIRPFGCDLCDVRFMFNCKRGKHMAMYHPDDFKCQICEIQFETADRYSQHMQQEHKIIIKVSSQPNTDLIAEDMKYYAKIDKPKPQETQGNNSLDNVDENSSLNQIETLHCDVCNIDLDSSRSYRQHMRDHVGGIDPMDQLQKPVEVKLEKETSEKVVECDLCDKKFANVMARNAHKKFKHGIHVEKQKVANQKIEFPCEVCDFTTYRRDYLEHHIKAQHGNEFSCSHCRRVLSSYNYYIYHVETNHYVKIDTSKLHRCSDCGTYFKMEENLKKHKEVKHGVNPPTRNHFCTLCRMDFKYSQQLATHVDTYTHKNMQSFFNGETSHKSNNVKGEPKEKAAINDSKHEDSLKEESIENAIEPEVKRPRLSSDEVAISDKDKLEYLKYLQTTDSGHFKCGICGKVKLLRKYMLHHLKQHKEVPTYDCDKCPERFVFKAKYDQHIQLHGNGSNLFSNDTNELNDHPKFQEVKKGPAEIKCTICNMTFKLTIILNKHNSTWHADDNSLKDLSMNEQKQKKNEAASVIKFLRCKHCKEAFIKLEELKSHMKDVHNSDSLDEDEEKAEKFNCDKCPLKFYDMMYLENHQKFFCVNRFQGKTVESRIVNEQ